MDPSFKRTTFVAGVLAWAAAGTVWAQDAPRTYPQDPDAVAAVKQNLKNVKLPPGFKVELYAMVPGARAIA